MGMSSGGGQSGGTVVQQAAPWASTVAGLYQANAATAAAQQAQQAANDSILSLNRMYQQARYDVQPYRTEGVQALNQLNQYLQLDPFNPGLAPTAPKALTVEDASKKIKQNDINDFIRQNTSYVGGGDNPKNNKYYSYNGPGVQELLQSGAGDVSNRFAGGNKGVTGGWYSGRVDLFGDPVQTYGQGGPIADLARKALAEQYITDQQPLYDQQVSAYNQDLNEYNQNLAMYDKYSAEGKYTSQQVSDKISNLPGYQAELAQGLDAIQKNASSKGYLGSGRLLQELGQKGQSTLSTFYGNELNRLAALAGAGQQAATQSGQYSMGNGQSLASIFQQLGDTKANASLAGGNALAQALLASNQQYKIIGQQSGGGGGLGGIGSVLGGIGSIASAFGSSKTLKTTLPTMSTEEILEKVQNMEIDKWKYKELDDAHIGPYAEDFHEAFGVGNSKTINMIDIAGVLLASVKELSHKVASLESQLHSNARKV